MGVVDAKRWPHWDHTWTGPAVTVKYNTEERETSRIECLMLGVLRELMTLLLAVVQPAVTKARSADGWNKTNSPTKTSRCSEMPQAASDHRTPIYRLKIHVKIIKTKRNKFIRPENDSSENPQQRNHAVRSTALVTTRLCPLALTPSPPCLRITAFDSSDSLVCPRELGTILETSPGFHRGSSLAPNF